MKSRNWRQTRSLILAINLFIFLVSCSAHRSASVVPSEIPETDEFPIEAERINDLGEAGFEVNLDDGGKRSYLNKPIPGKSGLAVHSVEWVDEDFGYLLVNYGGDEWGAGKLLDLQTGREYEVAPKLEFSDDGQYFFTSYEDWEARFVPNQAEIWSCANREAGCKRVAGFPGYAGIQISWPDNIQSDPIFLELSKTEQVGRDYIYVRYEVSCQCQQMSCSCSDPKEVDRRKLYE